MKMYKLKEEDVVYFLHIAKAAGTSFKMFLIDQFHSNEFWDDNNFSDLFSTSPSELAKYNLFCGHFGWYFNEISYRKPIIITMLREPGERTISHFLYERRMEDSELYYKIKGMSLKDFIYDLDEKSIPKMVNHQTASLAFDSLQNYLQKNKYKSSKELMEIYTDESLLRKAKSNLEKCAFVGVTERFEESIQLLCYKFGWVVPNMSSLKYNVAPKKIDSNNLPGDVLKRIEDINILDKKLYKFAEEIMSDALSSINKHEIEKSYNLIMGSKEKLKQVHFGFDKPINGSGWLSREIQPDGNVYRWTGPERKATIDIPLNTEGDMLISFYCAAYREDLFETIKLQVNGVDIDLDIINVDYNKNNEGLFKGKISADILKLNENYTHFEFSIKETICPKLIDPNSNDSRVVGIYFRWIDVIQDRLIYENYNC